MRNLYKSRCYLSGPIEDAKDFGVAWREKIIKDCEQEDLGISFIDPCKKPGNCVVEVDNKNKRIVDILRENKDWNGLRSFVKKLRREDLRFTDIADFLIVWVNPDCHMCGSYDECFTAERQRKPIFCIIEQGKERLPLWLFGVFKLENIFTSIDECVERLKLINEMDPSKLDPCWVLVGKELDID